MRRRSRSTLLILAGIFLIARSRWGLALQAIRDNEIAAESSGVDVASAKRLLYVAAAAGAAMLGALIGLAKLRISPDALFSVNDWTAYVIFITVIGGIGQDRRADPRERSSSSRCARRCPISARSISSRSARSPS